MGRADGVADRRAPRLASIRWRWIDWFDAVWQYPLVRSLLGSVATATSVVALAIYAPLRAIPIKAIREQAELASIDAQLVSAFGDLPVLLDDPVQAAIVRERLADAIRWTTDRGCQDVILIAHSGGAIVSYSTLLDKAYRDLPVTKLITWARALPSAGDSSSTTGPFVAGNPIRGDLGAARPGLRWVDFWASYDPAPAGRLMTVDGCPLVSVESVVEGQPASPIQVESRPITNFMHMGQDHDGYWTNDEGFLVPLIRHIDDPRGDGAGSRFYTFATRSPGPNRAAAAASRIALRLAPAGVRRGGPRPRPGDHPGRDAGRVARDERPRRRGGLVEDPGA